MTQAPHTSKPSLIEVDGTTREIFLLRGHMRSGTNWTCTVLNLHPRIFCEGEHHFERRGSGLVDDTGPQGIMTRDPELRAAGVGGLREMVRASMAVHASRHPGATRIGDRTPAPIADLLPGARVIHIVRDGRDVIVSRLFHTLRLNQTPVPALRDELAELKEVFAPDAEYFSKHPERLLVHEPIVREFARRWADVVRRSRAFIRLAEAGEVDASVLNVTYETLLTNPEEERARMYTFLGLDPSEAAPLESDAKAKPGFSDGTAKSFYRSGKSGDWEKYFTDDARRWFKEEAGELLVELGYEKDPSW